MTQEVEARELTRRGIARARQFLDQARTHPGPPGEVPPDLLWKLPCSRPMAEPPIMVTSRSAPFATRLEIGEYLGPRLRPVRRKIMDRSSFWSWLGMFHFRDTVQVKDGAARVSPLDETFVIDRLDQHNVRGFHRHHLRSSWLLHDAYGDVAEAEYLLNQAPWQRGDIADRIFQTYRVFNSAGIVALILRLYTTGARPKRGFQGRAGGLRHLYRVLDQLERTYDIYGMSPDALMDILPPVFDPWKPRGARRPKDRRTARSCSRGNVRPECPRRPRAADRGARSRSVRRSRESAA